MCRVQHLLTGYRVFAVSGQCRAHCGQLFGSQQCGALAGIHITGLHRVTIEVLSGVKQPGYAPVMKIGGLL